MINKYNIFWFRGREFLNFGDEIVPWLIEKMTNQKISQSCKPTDENVLLSLGSIMTYSNINTTIWGTGIIDWSSKIKQPKFVCSVRGHFSREKLLSLNINCPNFFGDPAILAKKYFDPKVPVQYEFGIVPHGIDFPDVYRKYKNVNNIKIIDLRTNDIEKIILEIKSCEKTITSALHGLIISVLYNKPTRWVKFSDKLFGDNIKFYDFFSSIDPKVKNNFDYKNIKSENKYYNPLLFHDDMINFNTIDKEICNYTIPEKLIQETFLTCPLLINKNNV